MNGEDGKRAPAVLPRANVLGVGIHAIDMPTAVSTIIDAARTAGLAGYVTVTGVHGVMESYDDPELRAIHNRSFLTVPDGTPTVWVGRRQGHSGMKTVYGPNLMSEVLENGIPLGLRHYLFGGGPGVVEQLEIALGGKFPGVRVVGSVTPPFRPLTDEEETELLADIKQSRPHIVWVGLSTPKQERFMAGFLERNAGKLELGDRGLVMIGVGAAFDYQSGLAKDQPKWIQGTGFGWAYRLVQEPRRLWRRYARNNPRFIVGVARQMRDPGRFPMSAADEG